MRKQNVVQLSDSERTELESIVTKGKAGAWLSGRAHTRLLSADSKTDQAIAKWLPVDELTVARTRQRWGVRHFPQAEVIRVVLGNLRTQSPAALYQAFAPAEALRILKKLEFHYTPKHGSWLNMAEIELSVRDHQGLNRRLPDIARSHRLGTRLQCSTGQGTLAVFCHRCAYQTGSAIPVLSGVVAY